MIKLLILSTLLLTSCSAPIDDFAIEDPQLVQIPDNATLEIKRTQEKQLMDHDQMRCKFIGQRASLDGDRNSQDLIVTTKDGCGWGASTGPIWALRKKGESFSVVFLDWGSGLTTTKIKQNGLRQIKVSGSTACWHRERLWQFDGARYVEVESRNDHLCPDDVEKK